ncbi:hypothetical protein D3C78_657840 [compost metagenome]
MSVRLTNTFAFTAERVLKTDIRFPEIMKQPGNGCQQRDTFCTVPLVLRLMIQHIFGGPMRGRTALGIETTKIPDNPQQLGLPVLFEPVTGHRGISPRRFTQQLAQCIDAFKRNGRLPGGIAGPFGKLVDNTATLLARVLSTA